MSQEEDKQYVSYLNKLHKTKNNALICRSAMGDNVAVKMLLTYGANPNASLKSGTKVDVEKIKKMYNKSLERTPFDNLNFGSFGMIKLEKGETALSCAVSTNNTEIVKLLVESGAVIDNQLLIMASEKGFTSVCKILVDAGADVNWTGSGLMENSLWAAVYRGHEGTVQWLLENGADANYSSEKGEYIIHQCIKPIFLSNDPAMLSNEDKDLENRYFNILKLLIERGAEIDARSDTYVLTPLMLACSNGLLKHVSYLLEKGANPYFQTKNGRNPIYFAIRGGYINIVKYLLENGYFDIRKKVAYEDSRGVQGELTCLHFACDNTNYPITKYLVESGAEIDAIDPGTGQTPLMCLYNPIISGAHVDDEERFKVFDYLVQQGADVNLVPLNGEPIVIGVARTLDDPRYLDLLLKKGADFEAKNSEGKTIREVIYGVAEANEQSPFGSSGHGKKVKAWLDKL